MSFADAVARLNDSVIANLGGESVAVTKPAGETITVLGIRLDPSDLEPVQPPTLLTMFFDVADFTTQTLESGDEVVIGSKVYVVTSTQLDAGNGVRAKLSLRGEVVS